MTAPKRLLALVLVLSAPLAASAQVEARPAEPAPTTAAAVKPAEPAPAPAPPPAAAPPAAKPAVSWASLVTIYGTLNANLQTTQAKGATNPAQDVTNRFMVSVDSSNIGFRGGLEVNEWIGAIYQCESGVAANGIGNALFCNRNSMVGVAGRWGRLFLGNWDTPFKALATGTKADDPFLSTDVYGFNALMGSPGFNYRTSAWVTASSTPIAGFDVRASNSVVYHSPKWQGLSAKLAWATNGFANASGTQNPNLYSAAVNWDSGPFSVMAGYERHDDGFALVAINGTAGAAFGSTAANNAGTATVANSTRDTAWRAGAGYQLDSPLGATTVGVLVDQLLLEQAHAAAGAVTRFKRLAWQVALKHRLGAHELRGRFNQADAGDCALNGSTCSTDGYGATHLSVGYAYYVAATFQTYLSFTKVTNQRNAQYTPSIGGSPVVAGTTPKGADPEALGLGVRYAF
jgi:predicted porin